MYDNISQKMKDGKTTNTENHEYNMIGDKVLENEFYIYFNPPTLIPDLQAIKMNSIKFIGYFVNMFCTNIPSIVIRDNLW